MDDDLENKSIDDLDNESLFELLYMQLPDLVDKSKELANKIDKLQTDNQPDTKAEVETLLTEKETFDNLIRSCRTLFGGDKVAALSTTLSLGWLLDSDNVKDTKTLQSYRRNESFKATLQSCPERVKHVTKVVFPSSSSQPNSAIVLSENFASAVKEIIQPTDVKPHGNTLQCEELLEEVQKSSYFTDSPPTPYFEMTLQPQEILPAKESSSRSRHAKRKGKQIMEKVEEKQYDGMITLKKWLVNNKVVEPLWLDATISVQVITDDFRNILRGILGELRKLHCRDYIHGELTETAVLVHKDFKGDVVLLNVYKRGERADDFKSLKEIIKYALSSPERGSLAIIEGSYPEDLSHYMNLLETSASKSIYCHSVLWSWDERIPLCEQFASLFYLKRSEFESLCSTIPVDVIAKFHKRLGRTVSPSGKIEYLNDEHTIMAYQKLYKERANKYEKLAAKVRPLIFMRDGDLHMTKYLSQRDMFYVAKKVHGSCTLYMAHFSVLASNVLPTTTDFFQIISGILDGYCKAHNY